MPIYRGELEEISKRIDTLVGPRPASEAEQKLLLLTLEKTALELAWPAVQSITDPRHRLTAWHRTATEIANYLRMRLGLAPV